MTMRPETRDGMGPGLLAAIHDPPARRAAGPNGTDPDFMVTSWPGPVGTMVGEGSNDPTCVANAINGRAATAYGDSGSSVRPSS